MHHFRVRTQRKLSLITECNYHGQTNEDDGVKQRPTYAHFGSVVRAIEMKILLLFLIEAIFHAEDKVQDSQSKQHLRS